MCLCQIRFIQLPVYPCQQKMNFGIAGVDLWQSQGQFSFKRGILEISFLF